MDKVFYYALVEFDDPDTGNSDSEAHVAPGVRFYSGLHVASCKREVLEDIRGNFIGPRHIEVRRVPELRPVFDEKREQVIGYRQEERREASHE